MLSFLYSLLILALHLLAGFIVLFVVFLLLANLIAERVVFVRFRAWVLISGIRTDAPFINVCKRLWFRIRGFTWRYIAFPFHRILIYLFYLYLKIETSDRFSPAPGTFRYQYLQWRLKNTELLFGSIYNFLLSPILYLFIMGLLMYFLLPVPGLCHSIIGGV